MELKLKPSHKQVKDYFQAQENFRKLGFEHEGAVKNAFAAILRTEGKHHGYTLIEEYPFRKNSRQLSIDGALIDDFKLSLGYWEAKDTKDDLDVEIKKKFETGYPRDNILFQSPERIVLYQNGNFVCDKKVDSPENLIGPLQQFFSYRPPDIEHWKQAVNEFSGKVREIADGTLKLIDEEKKTNKAFVEAYAGFTDLCRRSINPNISDEAIEEMLIQHLLTIRIFSKIFNNPDFANKNIIANEIEKVIDALTSHHFSRAEFLKQLDPFYVAIERAAATIDDYTRKQDFLNTVYEKFFQGFSVKVADTHGIAYTPQPIVDFMVNSVVDILQREFGRSLSDEGIHILDPFVGTGNFIMRIMRQIRKTALPDKYSKELHCNEVMLLPYYIASMNIEHAYLEMTGEYKPFDGICLVDTFGLAEPEQGNLFTEKNTERVERQKSSPIFIIIGNPPYNAGQVNENDNNKNRKYPVIDKRVRETYAKDSKATNVNKLGDPYVKAIRWASDSLGKEGILAFVTNNSFIDAIAFDGMRKHLGNDFSSIYHINLKGNARTSGERRRQEAGNVFEDAIRVSIGISFFIKKQSQKEKDIYLYSVDDYLNSEDKRNILDNKKTYKNFDFVKLAPDSANNWLTKDLNNSFRELIPLGSKSAKISNNFETTTIFKTFSNGIKTNNDMYVYNFNKTLLVKIASKMVDNYMSELQRWIFSGRPEDIEKFIKVDEKILKWIRHTKRSLLREILTKFDEKKIRESLYRPYCKMHYYLDRIFSEEYYQIPHIFPTPETEQENLVICATAIGNNKTFHCVMTNIIPDLHLTGDSQCFPFYTYDTDGTNRSENITDWSLGEFRAHYGDEMITKWDIFYYVYGVLHHLEYRIRYGANLRLELPRVPYLKDFRGFSEAGKQLAELHVNYENQPEYPLREIETPNKPLNWRVDKMKFSKDKTAIIYNDFLTIDGIPTETFEYRLGNRSALDWIVDQYRIKTDTRSGITSDPNNDDDRWYIRSLIKKIVTVSIGTVGIVKGLPEFEID